MAHLILPKDKIFKPPSEIDINLSKKFLPFLCCVKCGNDNYGQHYVCGEGHIFCPCIKDERKCPVKGCNSRLDDCDFETKIQDCLYKPCPDCKVWTTYLDLRQYHQKRCAAKHPHPTCSNMPLLKKIKNEK